MPFFDYKCKACNNTFEQLLRSSELTSKHKVVCPNCGSKRTARQLARIAACCGNSGRGSASTSGASCGPVG